jgi:MFS family permease
VRWAVVRLHFLLRNQLLIVSTVRSYATLLFERLGIDDVKSRIIAACNGTEYFLASLIAIALIERVGRRKLMLFGAVGQCLTMVLLAVLGSIDNPATQIVSAVLLFVFNSFFAIGWLGMTWLYVSSISPRLSLVYGSLISDNNSPRK